MPVGKKLAVVTSIVVVGVSGALFFGKGSSSDDPFAHHVERRVGQSGWTPSQPAQLPRATAAIQPTADTPAGATFHQSLRPVGSLLAPIDGVATEPAIDPRAQAAASNSDPRTYTAGEIRHTVADGDTLSKLAARYLGRSDAYQQIYELNREALTNPDLLPIGAVLRIPARGAVPAHWQAEPAPAMVPVPPRPTMP
jgi:hypothetical protein